MVTFVIINKGVVTVQTVSEAWPDFPRQFLKENPKARLYRKKYLMDEYTEYSLDKAKRFPRVLRHHYFARQDLPVAIQTALLLNPI